MFFKELLDILKIEDFTLEMISGRNVIMGMKILEAKCPVKDLIRDKVTFCFPVPLAEEELVKLELYINPLNNKNYIKVKTLDRGVTQRFEIISEYKINNEVRCFFNC